MPIRLYEPVNLNAIADRRTRAALKTIDDFLRSLYDGGPATDETIATLVARLDALEADLQTVVAYAVKTSNQAVTAVGYGSDVDVTELAFAVEAGVTYSFAFEILLTTNASTTGPRLAINGPAASLIAYATEYPDATVANTMRYMAVQSAYDSGDATAAGPGATGGPARLIGTITPTAAGTLTLRANTETGTTTILAGSFGTLHRTA